MARKKIEVEIVADDKISADLDRIEADARALDDLTVELEVKADTGPAVRSMDDLSTKTDKTGTVTTDANHTHTGSTITAAQFTAGNAITLTLTGAATHVHTVALSQAELTQINAGTRVQKASSNDNAHTHTVTFN